MLPPAAHAAGSSADIELVRPFFSPDALPGFDSPVIEGARHSRYGGLTQYQRDPLIVYEREDELGAAVSRRQVIALGASWDLGRAASARLVIPAALQWRSEVPDLSRDGPVLGDISAGLRFRFANARRVQWGASLDLYLPTGTREAWMGESIPRGRIGAPGLVQLGQWDLLVDAALMIRQPVITQQQFTLGQEVQAGVGARYHVWRDHVAVSAAYLSHNGMDTFFQSGVAENPSELLAVVQLEPRPDLQWDIGLGKGLADGYGTTELRVFAGVTWTRRPPPPEPIPQIVIAEVPKEVPPPVIEPDPEPEWEEEELAKVEGEKIVIREPIQFEFNTPNILPVSLPTLQYVAGLLNENWQIAHLVIEGHASDEGSFVYNYDLSIRRSRAIWEELLRSGVHPDRMSYRGMGEVVPVVVGGDEASLATNRRVEFRIVKQYAPGERPPDYRADVRLPWSGEPARITTPVAPPPEPEAPKKPTRDDGSDLDGFFDELEDEMRQEDGGAPDPAPGKEQAP